MTDSTITGFQAIQNAQNALKQGDKPSARRWATLAASLSPQREEPWLLLAALANPQASVGYLHEALKLNPDSPRARAGLVWAQKRIEASAQTAITAPHPLQKLAPVESSQEQNAKTVPVTVVRPLAVLEEAARPARNTSKSRIPFILILLFFVTLATVTLAIWNASPVMAFFSSQANSGVDQNAPSWALMQITKPTMTFTPTATFTATPTSTATPSISPTPTASQTPVASSTPDVTPTALPTDTGAMSSNSQSNLSVQELAKVYTGNKWILVDISEQHMYVYEGENLVYSFIASTGMNGATRVGTFSVLDKIPSAYGSTWNIWMPSWLGIYYSGTLENGIHALPILSNGAILWAGYLGTPISYGCVVLDTYDAQVLFNWVDIGTPVIIQR